jgi:hypothetical protein|tara:strand:+ start:223 stop:357 length:135 start_codon:yes stop_codon:yes gene_type:complete
MKNKNQDLAPAMAPGHFRMILKKPQAASCKRQATSLTIQDYKII